MPVFCWMCGLQSVSCLFHPIYRVSCRAKVFNFDGAQLINFFSFYGSKWFFFAKMSQFMFSFKSMIHCVQFCTWCTVWVGVLFFFLVLDVQCTSTTAQKALLPWWDCFCTFVKTPAGMGLFLEPLLCPAICVYPSTQAHRPGSLPQAALAPSAQVPQSLPITLTQHPESQLICELYLFSSTASEGTCSSSAGFWGCQDLSKVSSHSWTWIKFPCSSPVTRARKLVKTCNNKRMNVELW